MKTIDLNCDMGELSPQQATNYDSEIMPYISSCNIACGFHSGTPEIIENTIKSAIQHRVNIGAHPSYNDSENFGRVSVNVPISTLLAQLRYQIGAVKAMTESLGQRLCHVKPHGALYNDMVANEDLANAFVGLVKEIDPNLKIFALAHSHVIHCCQKQGMAFVREGFADRRYESINQLRNRRLEGAVIHDEKEVLAQIQGFLNHKITLWNQAVKDIDIDTISLHSDTKDAVVLSQKIHHYLKEKNVNIASIV